jgi:hypothetical protein
MLCLAEGGGVPGLVVGGGGGVGGGGLFDLDGVLAGFIDQLINRWVSIEISIVLFLLPYI